MPHRMFEYLRSGTPVLAIAPDGDTANRIRVVGVGCVVAPNDVAEPAKVLSYWGAASVASAGSVSGRKPK